MQTRQSHKRLTIHRIQFQPVDHVRSHAVQRCMALLPLKVDSSVRFGQVFYCAISFYNNEIVELNYAKRYEIG